VPISSGLLGLCLLLPTTAAGSIVLNSTALLSVCASSVADSAAQLKRPLQLDIMSVFHWNLSSAPSPLDCTDINLFWSDVAVDACQRSKLRRIESVDAVSLSIAKAGGNCKTFVCSRLHRIGELQDAAGNGGLLQSTFSPATGNTSTKGGAMKEVFATRVLCRRTVSDLIEEVTVRLFKGVVTAIGTFIFVPIGLKYGVKDSFNAAAKVLLLTGICLSRRGFCEQ
jgi:hypothetical protein